MVIALRRTTLSGNGIEGCSGLHLSPSWDISESVFCIASGLYARSQFVTEQETPQTRSIALSAARSLYMGTYTPKHSLVWMHRGFRFLPCPLPQGCFNRISLLFKKGGLFWCTNTPKQRMPTIAKINNKQPKF